MLKIFKCVWSESKKKIEKKEEKKQKQNGKWK